MSDTEIEYDTQPSGYDFDLTIDAQLNRIHDIHNAIREEGYSSFLFGDCRIPEITCKSYEQASRVRSALEMEDVEKHNCQHSIVYTGTSNGHRVLVSINRSAVCEIEYVTEEVTEMVPDPTYVDVAPLIEVTTTKTRTVYNCSGLGDE